MADREKLIELLFVGQVLADAECDKQAECNKCQYKAPNACRVGFIADNLIANGVTIQRWIPVTERLPSLHDDVLMYFKDDDNMAAGYLDYVDEDRTMWCSYSDGGYWTDCDYEPTHWMPLPEAPKGE